MSEGRVSEERLERDRGLIDVALADARREAANTSRKDLRVHETVEAHELLRDAFLYIDGALSSGGPLPQRWQHGEAARRARDSGWCVCSKPQPSTREGAPGFICSVCDQFIPRVYALRAAILTAAEQLRSGQLSHTDAANWLLDLEKRLRSEETT